MDIQPLKSYKILVIGDSCLDVYHYGTCERISPEAPVMVLKQTHTNTAPGMSANVVANVEAFGAEVQHATNEKTLLKHRYVDERFNQHLLRVDEGECAPIPPLDPSYLALIGSVDCVVVSDYNKGFLSAERCQDICRLCKEQQVPLFVDSKKTDLSCYSDCFLKINESEHRRATKLPTDSELIITLGEGGAQHSSVTYPVEKVEVFDVCGAGDVFLASLVAFYLLNNDLGDAIIKANKLASHSVTKAGTYILKEEDIRDQMDEQT